MSGAADAPLFEALIVPHRSLSRRGRLRLIGALGIVCGLNAALFVSLGAWPVSGFAGAELLLAAVLLQVNAHAARASELVLLSESGLRIVRTDPRGARRETALPAAWLRVVLEEPPGRVPLLWLAVRERREEIAASLGEAEKRDLAAALAAALQRWRSPVFDNPQLRGESPSVAGQAWGAGAVPSAPPSERIRS